MSETSPRRLRVAVLLNARGGTMQRLDRAEVEARITRALVAAGHEAEVSTVEPKRIDGELARFAATGCDAVVVGGGDGTVSAAVRALAGGTVALGVLPLGTMNLFARDLGMPLELDPAIDALGGAWIDRVDLGEVNGRPFVHHVSLGIHAWMIRHRERQQRLFRLSKWWAMLRAWARVFWRLPSVTVILAGEGARERWRTPLVIVANNPFVEHIGPLPEHRDMRGGVLAVYVGTSRGRLNLVRLAASVSLGQWQTNPWLATHLVRRLAIGARRRAVPASVDGEVVKLDVPLRVTSRPGALRVLRPRERAPR